MTTPRFRSATIALGFDTGSEVGLLVDPHGSLTTSNLSLRRLIAFAYDLQAPEISGPAALDAERYSIAAQAEVAPRLGDINPFRLMVRALLAERFALEFHWEVQRVKAFALDRVSDLLLAKQAAASDPGPVLEVHGPNAIGVRNAALSPLFTPWLSTRLGARVVNRTGLLGNYSFDLHWEGGPSDSSAEPLKTALGAQLGLALEEIETEIQRLVVDRVAPPANLEPTPVIVEIDVAILDRYVGRYTAPGVLIDVTREGASLFAELNRQGRVEIFPTSATEFLTKVMPARIEFVVDERGRPTTLVLRRGGREISALREDARR